MSHTEYKYLIFNFKDTQFKKFMDENELIKIEFVRLYNKWFNKEISKGEWIFDSMVDSFSLGYKNMILILILDNNCIAGHANSLESTNDKQPIDLICNVQITEEYRGRGLCPKLIANLINYLLVKNEKLPELPILPILLEVLIENKPAIRCYSINNFYDSKTPHIEEDAKWMILDKNKYIKNLIKELAILSYNINFNITPNIKEYRNLKEIITNYFKHYIEHNAVKID